MNTVVPRSRIPRQQSNHLGCGMQVHVRERLVEQKDFRVVQQRPRQRHALPHALRVLADGADEIGIKTDRADDLRAARAARRFRRAGQSIPGSPSRSSRHRAAKDAPCSLRAGRCRETCLSAEDRDVAARRLVESCQSAQQSSLAGAVIAENGVEFPAGKLRGDAAQSGKTAKLLDQVRDSDDVDGDSAFSVKGIKRPM